MDMHLNRYTIPGLQVKMDDIAGVQVMETFGYIQRNGLAPAQAPQKLKA